MAEKVKVQQNGAGGLIWFGGWLFTLGLLKLGVWKAILGLVVWPWYLGNEVAARLAGT